MNKNMTLSAVNGIFRLFVAMLVVGLWAFAPNSAQAQDVPTAGTLIGNQATATFNDAGGNTRTVTSNVVNTVVQQVYAVDIETAQTKQISPGGQLSFPHSITNNGNGADVFNISTVNGGDFAPTSVEIYADANNDGVPDDFTQITTTPSIPAGGNFNIVMIVNVPTNATSAQTATVTVTATSQGSGAATDNVIDTIQISDFAVINVVKSMSQSSGAPGSGPYTVTLTYTNTGNTSASAFELTDALPAGMNYVAGSGRWSVSGATVLTDAQDGQEAGASNINYDGDTTPNTIVAIIPNVAPGQSGTISFQVNIGGGVAPGILPNTATYEYNNGNTVVGDPTPFTSNTFNFTVTPTRSVTGNGQTVADAPQGGTVTFTNTFNNTGNVSDTYNVVVNAGPNPFPAGTSYILYKSDGVSPLLDTNGDGIPDTGPVAAGASYNVVLKVNLPSNAAGGPFNYTKTATSITDSGVNVTVTDELTIITSNSVDLTANAALGGTPPGEGVFATGEGAAVVTNTTNPNSTTLFTLFVNNTSTVSDNFDLAVSTDNTFGSITLPAGVTASFSDAGDVTANNTGTLNGGANKEMRMRLTFPPNFAPGTYSFYVRSQSPNSDAEDVMHVAVTINTVRGLTITPNNSGQIFPGGSVDYSHTIKNTGNVTENPGPGEVTVAATNSNTGFNTVLYLDVNGNGEIEAGDNVLTSANLGSIAPGAEVYIIAKVSATPGVTDGLNNTTTVTVTAAGAINAVAAPAPDDATDISTVITSNVSLVKRQALDVAPQDGTPDAAYTTSQIQAEPGQRILYEITITNLGTTNVTTVAIDDAIPPFTQYVAGSLASTLGTPDESAISSGTGLLTVDIPSLTPGQSAVITFAVDVNN